LWAANFFSRIFGKLLKIPVINTIHALPDFEGKFRNKIDNYNLKLATKVISVSENISRNILKQENINPESLITIQNGINIFDLERKFELAMQAKTRNNLNYKNILQNNLVIGTVGRFIKTKNQDLLIKAFKIINQNYPDTRLLLVGLGPEEENLKKLAKQLNLENKIVFIVNQPAYNYFQHMDIFVLPSKFEGLSIALLEALTCKLPVIVTGKNKIHEVIQDQINGIIIEPDNIQELSQNIIKLIKDNNLRFTLSHNSKLTVQENFDIQKTAHKYKNLFNKLAIK
jgi:glycosyltransferase involved in cell wall biosynthesis